MKQNTNLNEPSSLQDGPSAINVLEISDLSNEYAKAFLSECLMNFPKSDDKFIKAKLSHSSTIEQGEKGYEIKAALREMIGKNVSTTAIMDLVRSVCIDTFLDVIESINGTFAEDDYRWGLYSVDENGRPVNEIPYETLTATFYKIIDNLYLSEKKEEYRQPASSHKYKKGDQVKIVSNTYPGWLHYFEVPSTGVIESANNKDGLHFVRSTSTLKSQIIHEQNLTPMTS